MIAGGGTGGHLFPGIALAEEFKKRDAATEVVFVGTEHGIEAKIIPREGYPIQFLRAEGFVGKSFLKKMMAAVKTAASLLDARSILRVVMPDMVIGVGGYASGALVLMASFRSVPTLIHEQNSVPGATNRILGRFVDRVCVTYQESMPAFPMEKTFLTGNPIRMKIMKGDRTSASRLFSLDQNLFTIFIFGGSSGAGSINRTMVAALNHLTDLREKLQFLHQTGDKDFQYIREAYRKAGMKGTVAPFIYQMAEAYAAADVVISRAGATTLAELTALGKPAILVPYPHAAGKHQEFNAMKLRDMGAAHVLFDHEINGEMLARQIRELYGDDQGRKDMQRASRGLGTPEACSKIVDIAMSLLKNTVAKRKRG